MSILLTGIRRHALLSYFVLAYGISWIGIFLVVGLPGLRSGDLEMSRGLFVWFLMLCGPGISGVLMTWLTEGREGLRTFRARLIRWQFPLRWYATLLVAPVSAVLVVGTLWSLSGDFEPMASAEPDKALVVIMFFVLVFGAFVEELGWTGFATPKMRMVYSVVSTSLLLGFLHGAWHFLADFSGRGDASAILYVPRFIIFWIFALVVLRLLMVWSYQQTKSLLLGQLIHASYTAPLFLMTPPDASAVQLLILWTMFTIVFAIATLLITLGWSRTLGEVKPIDSPLSTLPIGRAPRTEQ